jgi:hypothetical protein
MKVVLRVWEPGDKKARQVGKIVPFCQRLVYTYNITDEDRMRALDAWGVAPCVLKLLLDCGVAEIHYADIAQRATWMTTPQRVLQYGIPQRFDQRPGVYFHLPLIHWKRQPGVMARLYPWASAALDLDWIEPAEVPGARRQLELLETPQGQGAAA